VSTSAVSYLVWGLLGVALAGLWWVSRRRPDAVAPPARVVERLATGAVWRVVLVPAFMWAGWHLFAR
jgi:Family of unknown function (DUF6186)